MRYLLILIMVIIGGCKTAEEPKNVSKHFCSDSCTVGGMKPLPIATDSQRFILVDSVDWLDRRMLVEPDTMPYPRRYTPMKDLPDTVKAWQIDSIRAKGHTVGVYQSPMPDSDYYMLFLQPCPETVFVHDPNPETVIDSIGSMGGILHYYLKSDCLYSTEAEICKVRGHTPSTGLVAIWDNEYVCKYCGTHFYIETRTTQREWGK